MKSITFSTASLLLTLLVRLSLAEQPAAPVSSAPTTQLDALKALAGRWVGDKPIEGMPAPVVEFKVTAAGSAVMETMFPGTDHEMVNLYHMDGDRLLMTHYCAQGIQPRMKLAAGGEKGVMNFEFLDCTNLKSRDEPHMDSVTVSVAGDKLTEDWAYYAQGKVTSHHVFELHRKS